jgi:transcriptional regulator with XRE-family HTH domain
MSLSTILIDRLMEYYNVNTISELAKKINIGQPAISKWKNNDAISAIKKKCLELNIYNEIFGFLNESEYVNGEEIEGSAFTYPAEYFNDETFAQNPYNEIQRKIEEEVNKKSLELQSKKIMRMDASIITSFIQVYEKLEKEGKLKELYDALGKLKFGSSNNTF